MATSVCFPSSCPYFQIDCDSCQASTSAMPVNSARIFTHCRSEDYDYCAIFLAKALRATRLGGYGRQTRELSFK